MKTNRVLDGLIILIIVASIGFGIATRFSYTDYTSDSKIMEKYKNSYKSNSSFSFEEILPFYSDDEKDFKLDYDYINENAEVIVKVKKISSKQKHQATLSDAKVLEVYKGKDFITGDEIKVYEEYFYFFEPQTFINISGYVPMNNKEEYILFLKRKYRDYQYRSDEERNQFVIFGTSLGKHAVKKEVKNYRANGEYVHSQIEAFDLVCESNGDLKDYVELHSLVIENYAK